MTPALHALTQLLASRMVDSLAWGTVTVLFAATLLRVTRQNAATRFAVWFSALMAIGLVPWLAGGWRPSALISTSSTGGAAITLPDRWALYLCAAWAVIVALFAIGIGRAVWHLHVLRRNSVALDPAALDSALRETFGRHGADRGVTLCTSDQVRVPTAIGFFSPAIVLPRWVMNELSVSEVNQILLHELAHLQRFDDWTNLFQQAMKAVFFFHPAVWWIEKKVALEREMACDDAVLAETISPRAYAECLAHLAEKTFLQRTVILAQAALGKIRHTSLRVAEILNGNAEARTRSWKPAVSIVTGFAIACGVWSARVPKLIAFRDSATSHGVQEAGAPNFAQIQRVDSGITQSVPVTAAKFISHTEKRTDTQTRTPAFTTGSAVARVAHPVSRAANTFHLTAAEPVLVPFTETVFFVFKNADGTAPAVRVDQIQTFRLTILHSAAEPTGTQITQKET